MSPTTHKDLRVTEAARVLGVHENTVRNAIKRHEKSGGMEGLRAVLKPGPWGKEQYAIHAGVLKAWALARYGRYVGDEEIEAALGSARDEEALAPTSPDMVSLYERLLEAQTVASRAQAIEAATIDLRAVLEDEVAALRAQLARKENELLTYQRALLERERRSFWQRLLRGNGDPLDVSSDEAEEDATEGA